MNDWRTAFLAKLTLIRVIPTAIWAFNRKLNFSFLMTTITPRTASSTIWHRHHLALRTVYHSILIKSLRLRRLRSARRLRGTRSSRGLRAIEPLRGQRNVCRRRGLRRLVRSGSSLRRAKIGTALLAGRIIRLVESAALDALNCGDTSSWSEAHDVSLDYDRTITRPALRKLAGSGNEAPA